MPYTSFVHLSLFSASTPELLFSKVYYIGKMNLNGSMVDTVQDIIRIDEFDIDTVESMLYYYDVDNHHIKRSLINQDGHEIIYTKDGLIMGDIAVDWLGRYAYNWFIVC